MEGAALSDNVYRVIEVVGSAKSGTDEAIRNAIARASQTVNHLDWFEVTETRGHIEDGQIAHFQVTLKVGFKIEGP
ncbi:hypothetical protein SAMN04488548_1341599 [Gordonia westfalica]|uniref:Flavin-binding protein dodecin n=1 Tax=Gordonia westfalica TaxID=158898 RepID=A0A1H2J008_9ACTN|nr:hypothetical protein SAMN04488548_1341599 [Gordonia westfalica]